MQDWVLNCEYFKTVQRIIYIKKLLYHYSVHSGGSLRGSHKNYLATILRLHQLRMNYLAEFFEATREDLRRKCVIRFMNMALYATFEYEFLFKETTVKDKLERIAAVIENPEIRSNINETVMAGLNLTLLCKVQWRLFRLRMPVIIYGFARGLAFARNIKIMCGSLYKSLVKRRFMLAT